MHATPLIVGRLYQVKHLGHTHQVIASNGAEAIQIVCGMVL